MLCFTLYDVVSDQGLVHFLNRMLPTDNVFLQNKLFKKCFEIQETFQKMFWLGINDIACHTMRHYVKKNMVCMLSHR